MKYCQTKSKYPHGSESKLLLCMTGRLAIENIHLLDILLYLSHLKFIFKQMKMLNQFHSNIIFSLSKLFIDYIRQNTH